MSMELNKESVEQAGGDERAADEKPRATRCPDCGEHDLMPGDLCACGYETDPAAGCACPECDGSGDGCVGEVCRECDGSGWFERPEQARAALAQPSPALPPFAEKVLAKLRRFYDCAEDFESGGVDIGRHWLDLLTQLGLLNRVQRSPAFWEISQQGEDLLGMPQPSPAQAEQAEAERPEVVARVVHSNPVVLGQCGPLNANDELMTVAQHAASVARWAEMFNRVEQERDAALARVAELTATRNRYGVDAHYFNKNLQRILRDFESFTSDELARSLIILAKVADEKVVAQAQHSVPEEFIGRLAEFLAQRGVTGRALLRDLRKFLAAAPGKEGV
ncbi:TPA: hypothetical protein ACMFPV_005151 [Pseudomonas aeruginosa]